MHAFLFVQANNWKFWSSEVYWEKGIDLSFMGLAPAHGLVLRAHEISVALLECISKESRAGRGLPVWRLCGNVFCAELYSVYSWAEAGYCKNSSLLINSGSCDCSHRIKGLEFTRGERGRHWLLRTNRYCFHWDIAIYLGKKQSPHAQPRDQVKKNFIPHSVTIPWGTALLMHFSQWRP